ncbi:MAG: 4-hydroxythreonine-4-phosphate dehydrogenase PdxA [Gammaproteobacteria bacterium]
MNRIVITPGEPAGIGPDIVLQTLCRDWPDELVVVASPELLESRAKQLGLDIHLIPFDENKPQQPHSAGEISIIPVSLHTSCTPGQLNVANAPYVIETLKTASTLCLQKKADRYVTAPVHKGIINDAGITFTGHTEYLANLAGIELPVMMLASNQFRVALATTHVPLTKVSETLTKDRLRQVITVLHQDLKTKFKLPQPKIYVCGLNPHAGENGHLGDEEITTIQPVIEELKKTGMTINGPLPADTIFTPQHIKHADVILAMYHDQGLPVIKHTAFGEVVNITLGLPYLRTSVDHGTALDLAGTGKATTNSLQAALLYQLK